MCLAQGPQGRDAVEAQTRGLSGMHVCNTGQDRRDGQSVCQNMYNRLVIQSSFACQRRILSSDDNLYKQVGPRSGPTERWAWSGSNPFDTPIVFLKDFFERINFENSQQTIPKVNEKLPSIQRFKSYIGHFRLAPVLKIEPDWLQVYHMTHWWKIVLRTGASLNSDEILI